VAAALHVDYLRSSRKTHITGIVSLSHFRSGLVSSLSPAELG
jgi:hypothetical protein